MILDDLTFIKIIGKGSYGEVYLTSQKGHSEFFATKIVKRTVADSSKVKRHFQNEIKILKETKHKNIMKLIEMRQTTENYYLVCEFCNGGSLRQCVNKYLKMYKKTFSEEITQFLMRQIVEALKYLHDSNIMHRDLKLDNILLNFKDENDKNILNMYGAEVKIIDFGFASYINKKMDLHKSVLGSPLYMDPKMLNIFLHKGNKDNFGYDEKIDIWSLGNICYQMLMGKLAFETNDMKVLEEKLETGVYYLPTTSYKEVVGFLIAMLQYDPELRLNIEDLSKHDFLCKNVRHFERIDINKYKKYIKNDKIVINIKEDRILWNLFNKKISNKFLDIIPEDTEVSESVMNNIVNYKDENNSKSDQIKAKLIRAFDKMNEDFMYIEPCFIPIIPGNDPKDKFNDEKQL